MAVWNTVVIWNPPNFLKKILTPKVQRFTSPYKPCLTLTRPPPHNHQPFPGALLPERCPWRAHPDPTCGSVHCQRRRRTGCPTHHRHTGAQLGRLEAHCWTAGQTRDDVCFVLGTSNSHLCFLWFNLRCENIVWFEPLCILQLFKWAAVIIWHPMCSGIRQAWWSSKPQEEKNSRGEKKNKLKPLGQEIATQEDVLYPSSLTSNLLQKKNNTQRDAMHYCRRASESRRLHSFSMHASCSVAQDGAIRRL